MNRVNPPSTQGLRETHPEFVHDFNLLEKEMGFIPQNILMMTHWPELTKAFMGIVHATETSRTISEELQDLVWIGANMAATCNY